MMRISILTGSAVVALLSAPPAMAQELAVNEAAQAEASVADPEPRDPEVIAALDKMGADLRSLQSFGLSLAMTTEEVLTTGQKVQHSGTAEYGLRRPDALRIETKSDRVNRTVVYDGKTFTLFAPRVGYYATFPAPGTIKETLEQARDKLGLELPITELFTWGADPDSAAPITSAFSIGPETISGQLCDQYAFRQEGIDWQIWLRQGARALPCKIVIARTDDSSMPEFAAVFEWRLDQVFAADAFTFSPPTGARRIEFSPPQAN
jgi:hypothetical protein